MGGERFVTPEFLSSGAVGQFKQQGGADIVSAVGRADRSAKDEAIFVALEVFLVIRQVCRKQRPGIGDFRAGAEVLLQALAPVVGLAFEEAVRPALDRDPLDRVGAVQRLAGNEGVGRRAVNALTASDLLVGSPSRRELGLVG